MPAIPALTEPLSDGHIRLRAASERDIPEILIAYEDDPQLHLRLGEDRPPSGAQLGTRAELAAAELAAGSCARLTILEPGSEDCRGQLTLHTIDWDHAPRGAAALGRPATAPARVRAPRAAAAGAMVVQ